MSFLFTRQRAAERALRSRLVELGAKDGCDFAITNLTLFPNDEVMFIHKEQDEWQVTFSERALTYLRYWSLDFENAADFLEKAVRAHFTGDYFSSGSSPAEVFRWEGMSRPQRRVAINIEDDMCRLAITPQSIGDGLPDWRWPPLVGRASDDIVWRKLVPSDAGLSLDRIGSPRGEVLWRRDAPFGARSLPPEKLAETRRGYRICADHPWVRDHLAAIERMTTVPNFDQPGGALRYRLFDPAGRVMAVDTATAIGLLVEESLV